jgi:radical SAM superfamily enzyme YgiQ (UPF0313 family)
MNARDLKNRDIQWADYVFISAMITQRNSAREVINRCNKLGTKIVAGGPLFTTEYENFKGVDHFVLDEAEITLPSFLNDLEMGNAQFIYTSKEKPDITKTPIPKWSLVNINNYSSMNIQYSRGCPYNCEFCDIVVLNGHKPRTKDKRQILAELESLYQHGWRAGVFVVDDNLIGNKRKLKEEILPAIIGWMQKRKYPFALLAETSMNLADDEELMRLMVDAGFDTVFIGVESPHEESLTECNKHQNKKRDLISAVRRIQNYGIQVQGGFIVGFDSDPISIFKSQISFIQKSGIVTAMVGLLNAPRGTRLYRRLEKEKRLLDGFSGDNTDCSINFKPKMKYETLINGYKHILETIYSHKHYYERVKTCLKEYRPKKRKGSLRLRSYHLTAFIKSMWFLGIWGKGKGYFWKLILSTIFKRPHLLPLAITLSVYGFHFRKVAEKCIRLPATGIAMINKVSETGK